MISIFICTYNKMETPGHFDRRPTAKTASDLFHRLPVSEETYYSVKRDLLQCQKRPTTVSKETYYSVKRDLLQCQKRPTTVSKETYYSVKRDLLQCQKRPTTCLPCEQGLVL